LNAEGDLPVIAADRLFLLFIDAAWMGCRVLAIANLPLSGKPAACPVFASLAIVRL
jgi:hypothetical protein